MLKMNFTTLHLKHMVQNEFLKYCVMESMIKSFWNERIKVKSVFTPMRFVAVSLGPFAKKSKQRPDFA